MVSFTVLTAQAANGSQDGFYYETNIRGDIIITKCYSGQKTLTIPSQIDGRDVVEIGMRAFQDNKSVRYITLPETLEVIGYEAFWGSNVTSVTLPQQSKLKTIGERAFAFTDITSFVIPASVTSIGTGAFLYCDVALAVAPANETFAMIDGVLFRKTDKTLICYPKSLNNASYAVPHGILKIGEDAFAYAQVQEVTLPSSVVEIESGAFSDSWIREINLSEGLVTIGYAAFSDCAALKTFIFPKSVETTGERLFSNCDKLHTITIPEGSKLQGINNWNLYDRHDYDPTVELQIPNGVTINEGAFSDFLDACDHLKLTINETNTHYKLIDGALFDIANGTLLWYPPTLKESVYYIPEGIKRIAEAAFADNSKIQEVIVPNTVEEIGDYAFYDCNALRKVNIPSNTAVIGESVFKGCSKIMVTVENNPTAIEYLIKEKITFTEASSNNTDWLTN